LKDTEHIPNFKTVMEYFDIEKVCETFQKIWFSWYFFKIWKILISFSDGSSSPHLSFISTPQHISWIHLGTMQIMQIRNCWNTRTWSRRNMFEKNCCIHWGVTFNNQSWFGVCTVWKSFDYYSSNIRYAKLKIKYRDRKPVRFHFQEGKKTIMLRKTQFPEWNVYQLGQEKTQQFPEWNVFFLLHQKTFLPRCKTIHNSLRNYCFNRTLLLTKNLDRQNCYIHPNTSYTLFEFQENNIVVCVLHV
jgi:hypothetical protein